MKYTLILFLIVTACANQQDNQTTPTPACHWYAKWSCEWNGGCATSMGAWSGVNAYTAKSACTDWETDFLNTYGNPAVSVSPCSCE